MVLAKAGLPAAAGHRPLLYHPRRGRVDWPARRTHGSATGRRLCHHAPRHRLTSRLPAMQEFSWMTYRANQDTGQIEWDTELPSSPYGAAAVTNNVVFTTTF